LGKKNTVNSRNEQSNRPIQLFSGALGTLLMADGLAEGAPSEQLTLSNPDAVSRAHRAYQSAGATYHKTNTFNANRIRLRAVGMEDQWEHLNRAGVKLAREAIEPQSHVVGTLGPTGQILSENHDDWRETLIHEFRSQAELLLDAGADLLLIETMYDLREALTALEACKSIAQCQVLVSLTFTQSARGFLTYRGDASGDALKALVDAGADAVGTNCNLDSATCATLAPMMRAFLPDVPLIIQPCAGQPRTLIDSLEYPDTPADFAENMSRIADVGIDMLGGCCGTTPQHIAQLHATLTK
jgi:methionine synthase I (cobalamin-dependent)